MSTSSNLCQKKFHMNIKLDEEYATWRRANAKSLKDTTEANRLRTEGRKHIDLWVDGSLYPIDPLTNKYPSFYTVHDLIRFVGDGMNGLLGYCMRLCQFRDELSNQNFHLNNSLQIFQNQVSVLKKKIEVLENLNKSLENRLDRLKSTPIGLREKRKRIINISNLLQASGGKKRRMKLTKQYVTQISGLDIQKSEERVKLLNETMSKTDFVKILQLPENNSIKTFVLKKLLEDFKSVTPSQIVETCDTVGVSRRGYRALSKLWYQKLSVEKFKPFGLPRPHRVVKARQELNLQIPEVFGDYFHIEGSMPFEKQKKCGVFEYNSFNNIWVDIKRVQTAMIKFYGLTVEECSGHLIFVLKLDEAQMAKNQKMERVSIAIMNRSLEYSQRRRNTPGHSVQSEMELWWIGCAQVPIESYETLKWIFSHTNIPNIIETQNAGEIINVDSIGNFTIEWHMSADLKALKSMFGISGGANSKYPCLYCMASMGTKEWCNTSNVGRPPTRNNLESQKFDKKNMIWDPILPILLKNVHICTLHAEIRILDKLLRLHLDYAYSLKPTKIADECIDKCEILLSKMGFHGGQVQLRKDSKLSGKSGDVLADLSMGGSKARRFLSNHDQKQVNNMWECWKEFCQITTNVASNPQQARKRMEVWMLLDEFLKLLRMQVTTLTYAEDYKEAIKNLIQAMKEAWGEKDITFYLVRLKSFNLTQP